MARNIHTPFYNKPFYKGYLNEKYFNYCFPEPVVMLILFLLFEMSLKPNYIDQFDPIGIKI